MGNVTKKLYVDNNNTTNNFYTWYEYDQAGRLKKVLTNRENDRNDAVTDANYNQYIAGGQVKQLILGNSVQTVNYKYNERDWLKEISSSKYWQHIGYNNSETWGGFTFQPRYNGNISWITYSIYGLNFTVGGHSSSQVGWMYTYDNANRLTNADFGSGYYNTWNTTSAYDLPAMSYDQNGNITNLQRNNGSAGALDRLAYTYQANTNCLTSITNTASGTQTYNYTYDKGA